MEILAWYALGGFGFGVWLVASARVGDITPESVTAVTLMAVGWPIWLIGAAIATVRDMLEPRPF